MNEFLTGLDWPFIVKMAALAVALIGGAKTVPLVNKLKELLDWSGRKVQFLVIAVSVVLALLTQIATGVLSPEPISPDLILTIFIALVTASQAEYRRIKDQIKVGE